MKGNTIIEFSCWSNVSEDELACLLESAAATIRHGGDAGESWMDGKLIGKWRIRGKKPTKHLTTDNHLLWQDQNQTI